MDFTQVKGFKGFPHLPEGELVAGWTAELYDADDGGIWQQRYCPEPFMSIMHSEGNGVNKLKNELTTNDKCVFNVGLFTVCVSQSEGRRPESASTPNCSRTVNACASFLL